MYKIELKVVENFKNNNYYNYYYWSNVDNDFTEETTFINEFYSYKQNKIVNSAIEFIKQNFNVNDIDDANISIYNNNIEINHLHIFLEDLK